MTCQEHEKFEKKIDTILNEVLNIKVVLAGDGVTLDGKTGLIKRCDTNTKFRKNSVVVGLIVCKALLLGWIGLYFSGKTIKISENVDRVEKKIEVVQVVK